MKEHKGFTPGPWVVKKMYGSPNLVIEATTGMYGRLAVVDGVSEKVDPQVYRVAHADADLIADAPALLAERDQLLAQRDELRAELDECGANNAALEMECAALAEDLNQSMDAWEAVCAQRDELLTERRTLLLVAKASFDIVERAINYGKLDKDSRADLAAIKARLAAAISNATKGEGK